MYYYGIMFGLRKIALGYLTLLCLSVSLQAQDKNPLIKVMSFNIRYGTAQDGKNVWSNRKDFVIETIKQFDPDLSLGAWCPILGGLSRCGSDLPWSDFLYRRDRGSRADPRDGAR